MMKRWVVGMLVLVAAAVGLISGEEKGTDDLALVPGTAKLVVSFRPADMWAGKLAGDVRKALGDDVKHLTAELEKTFTVGPDALERVTFFVSSIGREEEIGFVLKFKKKIDARKVLGEVVRGGMVEKMGDVEVYKNYNTAAFVKGGIVLVLGTPPAIKSALEGKAKRSEGLVAALKRIEGGKDHLIGYFDGSILPEELKSQLPAALAMLKPLLEVKEMMVWSDVGMTTKVSAWATFVNEEKASRSEKTLKALKALGVATLSNVAEDLKKGPKDMVPLADLALVGEKALDGATLTRKDGKVEMAVSVTVSDAAFVATLKTAVIKVREAAARSQSQNNLKQIGLAMHNYHDAMGALPPQAIYDKDGKALLSWRVLILPYIEQDALYREFKLDEPWDSPNNKKLIAKMPMIYKPVVGKATEPHGTFYQVFVGKGAIFDGKRGLRLTDIRDGTSNTILAVEAGKDVVWTKPDDVPFEAGKKLPALGGDFEDGFNALFADGSVRFIMKTIKPDTLKALITRDGGEPIGGFEF